MDILLTLALTLVTMILSLTVHEFAHAFAARRLGDDTAERMGRLNLNPASHIDPVGTLLLPSMIILLSGAVGGLPFFGWAKPVPVDPARFRRDVDVRRGNVIVSFAGPLSNLLLSVLCVAVIAVAMHTGLWSSIAEALRVLLTTMVGVNVGLFFFNMLPIYPLDGHHVAAGFMTPGTYARFQQFGMQYGSMLLLVLIMMGGGRLLAWPVRTAVNGLFRMAGVIPFM